jgi:hypothetical protein
VTDAAVLDGHVYLKAPFGAAATWVASSLSMSLPSLEHEPDLVLVNAVTTASSVWPYGTIRTRSIARIGVDFGLSGGQVYRVEASAEDGGLISFVLKREGVQAVERAARFHRLVGKRVAASIPAYLGSCLDHEHDTGVLLLEDVAPAEQGDVLSGCTDLQALSAVRSLARIHALTWNMVSDGPDEQAIRWQVPTTAPDRWAARLAAAEERFPDIVAPFMSRLQRLAGEVETANGSLRDGDACWIHRDAHLDNVLFRPDGTAVLMDWSSAVIGPPAVDLARLLTEGINAAGRGEQASELVCAYVGELARCGRTVSVDELWDTLSGAILLLIQAAVGWAARDEHRQPVTRMRALQRQFLLSAVAWFSHERMTLPGRLFENGADRTLPGK